MTVGYDDVKFVQVEACQLCFEGGEEVWAVDSTGMVHVWVPEIGMY